MSKCAHQRRKGFIAAFSLAAAAGAGFLAYEASVPLAEGCRLSAASHERRVDGNGAPVLVIPGFLNGDAYTYVLRDRLNQAGFQSYGWNAGINMGADQDTLVALRQQLSSIYTRHGRKVSLVGYSLGGVYARELAKTDADKVERVVTLAAPFALEDGYGNSDRRLHAVFEAFHRDIQHRAAFHMDGAAVLRSLKLPPAVPTTTIYSRNDMLVPVTASRVAGLSTFYEEIAVVSGHLAMPFNAAVSQIVVNRLSEPLVQWKPAAQVGCPH